MSSLVAAVRGWRALASLTALTLSAPACTIIHYHDGTGPQQDPGPQEMPDPPDEKPKPTDGEPEYDEPVAKCLAGDAQPIELITEPSGTLAGCDVARRGASALNVNGFATASDETLVHPSKAFDGNSGTKVTLEGDEPWLAYEFPEFEAQAIASYAITPASDSDGDATDFPSSWELQGSNAPPCAKDEDIEWTTVDARTDELFVLRHDTRVFKIDSPTSYHRYRFRVTGSTASSGFELSELQLFGPGEPAFSIDDTFAHTDENAFTTKAKTASTIDHESTRFHGSSSWASKKGDVMKVAFVGSYVKLFAVKDPAHGLVGISIDEGEEQLADLYAETTAYNREVWASEEMCPGAHVLTLRVSGEKNEDAKDHFISIDRVEVVP